MSNAAGLTMQPPRSLSLSGNDASGAVSLRSTVWSSTISTVSTPARSPAATEPSVVFARSRLALTASASNGVPSWNETPPRSCMRSTRPSSRNSQDSANPGIAVPSGERWTSRSKIGNTHTFWIELVCLIGSNPAGPRLVA